MIKCEYLSLPPPTPSFFVRHAGSMHDLLHNTDNLYSSPNPYLSDHSSKYSDLSLYDNQLERMKRGGGNKNDKCLSSHLSCIPYVWQCRIFRMLGVGITCFISSLKPNFSLFSSIVGSVIITIIGF